MRAYRIAYDGRPFYGFQRQPDVPTVEDTLLSALADLGILEEREQTPPNYAAAGRTDAGVSAAAQTVSFECPDWLSPSALNSRLPGSVCAWASADPGSGFHATHDAQSRTYTYYLHASGLSGTHVGPALDRLAGTHDFHNLTPDETGTRRTLSTAVSREAEFLVLEFRAGGFARQLVRRLVSLVAAIGRQDRDVDGIDRVLSEAKLDGPDGIPPAPPHPLVLTGVSYPALSFTPDDEAVDSLRTCFEQRRVERLTRSHVASAIARAGIDDGKHP